MPALNQLTANTPGYGDSLPLASALADDHFSLGLLTGLLMGLLTPVLTGLLMAC